MSSITKPEESQRARKPSWRYLRRRRAKEESMPTREEEIIRRYFEAFNNHDLEGVIACFHPEPVVVDSEGQRVSLRVGEVAARAGVHRETLRYYERRGLIPPRPAGPRATLNWSEGDAVWLS